jgi:tight adherence protein B
MLILIALVFTGAFLVFGLVMYAHAASAAQQSKRTVANLDSALTANKERSRDPTVDIRKADVLSAVPWINRWLMDMELAPYLRALLSQADLKKWTAGRLLLMSILCFVISAYLAYLRTSSASFALMIGLIVGLVPVAYVFQKRRKRFNAFEQGLPEALDLMVSALRAGHSLIAAIRLVALESPNPIGAEFRICFEEQTYGLELRTAMDNLLQRIPLQDLRIVAAAILIQKESGGNLAEVLNKAAQVIRERFRLRRQVLVHTAQGRLTGLILASLPVVLALCLYIVNPQTMSLLWKNPIGLKLLYAATGMTIVGGLIIRKIINMEV